ncbi:AAA family ATPase [Dyadobacter sp. NIV53]|uniref:AAA family ATPase n=1 Tax=Dyadobacter sp. NIV53 TaxID=2861765 RepID=UPI001C877FCF|nr:AAA family ATPase [Dyadobacter sp. NIV53]
MIKRGAQSYIANLLRTFPAVAILGPRQVGKTTLAHLLAAKISPEPIYLDLEIASDLAKLKEPELYFENHDDRTIILDEIQRVPEISLRSIIKKL